MELRSLTLAGIIKSKKLSKESIVTSNADVAQTELGKIFPLMESASQKYTPCTIAKFLDALESATRVQHDSLLIFK